jgi:hypothetical protein
MLNDFELSRLRVADSCALSLIVALFLCGPLLPGLMSYDSLFAYSESINGITTRVYPPAQAYLLFLSRISGLSTFGYFLAQAWLLLFSMFAIGSAFSRTALQYALSCAATVAAIVILPFLWGTLGVIWKDVTTASFALFGIVGWLAAIRRRSIGWLILAGTAYGVAVALRHNALPLVLPLLLVMAIWPLSQDSTMRQRLAASAIGIAALAGATLSVNYRLPDLRALNATLGFEAVQLFDIIGISVCAGENFLPLAVSEGRPVAIGDLAQMYDPRHLHLTLRGHPDFPPLIEGASDVPGVWWEIVPKHLGCYLWHRRNVARELTGAGVANLFYPTHPAIDENPYGLKLWFPEMVNRWGAYIKQLAGIGILRPVWLFLAAATLCTATLRRGDRGKILRLATLAGAFGYAGALVFAAPAADARYLFPSSMFCLAVAISSVLLLVDRWRLAHRRRSA